jgi:transposase
MATARAGGDDVAGDRWYAGGQRWSRFHRNQEAGVNDKLQSVLTAFLRLLKGRPAGTKAVRQGKPSGTAKRTGPVPKRTSASKAGVQKMAARKMSAKSGKASSPGKPKKPAAAARVKKANAKSKSK